MATMTFLINDSSTGGNTPVVQVTITENLDGTLTFTLTQLAGYVGDLRGLFFDVADESLIGSLTAAGIGLTELQQGNDTITNLGGGANMSGLLGDAGGYDVGVEIGSSGLHTTDDIRKFTFRLDSTLRDLTLADFSSMSFGARVTSVGLDSNLDGSFETSRSGSSKTGEVTFAVISPTTDSAAVTEDATASGNVLGNDGAGAGDVLTVNGWSGGELGVEYAIVELGYATIQLNADGSYLIDASAADALAAGESVSHTFTYNVLQTNIDGTSTHTVSFKVTIHGSNDQPTLTIADASGDVTEGDGTAALSDSGVLSFADLDATDVVTVSQTSNADIVWSGGTLAPALAATLVAGFSVDQDSWDYATSANLDFLGVGETITFSYNVVATDDSGAPNAVSAATTVTITINGSNDGPVAHADDNAGDPVNEGGALPPNLIARWLADGNTDDSVGNNDGALQNGASFAPGESGQAFNFDGVNDAFAAPTTGLPTGNSDRTISLWMKADAFSIYEAHLAGYGTFGSFGQTYQLGTSGSTLFFSQWGQAVFGPSLQTGQWYHVAVTNVGNSVTLYLDGVAVATGTLPINTPAGTEFLAGARPPINIPGSLQGQVDDIQVYDRALTPLEIQSIYNSDSVAAGNVLANDTDVDSGDSKSVIGVAAGASPGDVSGQVGSAVAGTYGTLTLASDGTWNYALDNGDPDTDQLGQNQTAADVFTYTMTDAHGATSTTTLTVTINGSNDGAVIGGVASGDVTEDTSPATLTASGVLTITDVDAGQANFTVQAGTAGSNGYGMFTLNAAGNWTYSADNTQAAIQQLNAGQTLTDSFSAVSSDGSASEVVTVTIHGQDDGPFGFYPVRQYSAPGTGGWALTAGDFNGDGSNDIAVTTFLSQRVYTMLNDSSGALLTTASVATSRPGPIETADLNGDGKLDLVTGNAAGASVTILMGNGDGTFSGPTNFVTHGNIRGIAIGDVDGDGKLDIASSNSDGFVSVLMGNGDGTFQTQTAYLAGSNPLSIALGDINGDGSLDMVTGNESANSVSVFLNQGDGTFQFTSLLSPAASTPQDVELADLNGDGNIDMVVACRNGNAVSISLGNGDGTFGNAVAYAAGLQTSDVAVGDLNGDGYLDVAAANINTSDISVLLGNGDGTFQSQFAFVVGLNPGPIEIVDLNGDGKLDIAALTSGSFSISELLNTGNWDMII